LTSSEHSTPALNTTRLFAYGTLRPGQSNFGRIAEFVVAHEPATIEGELVDLGAYPALIEGDGIVEGDLLTMQLKALDITDRIEGYQPERSGSFYVRRKVTVTLLKARATVHAWTYFFACPDQLSCYPKAVVGQREGKPVFNWPIRTGDSLPFSGQNESKS
jgi:gamma-glutamylcyclotransferase (GGCT)/AIG2-like uncharacterized protein YtfP